MVSLIIIGISFYVKFVTAFLPKSEIEYIMLNHPRIFAVIFTLIILFSYKLMYPPGEIIIR
ncbi:hypothetical protein KEJ32_06350, partial [Candidatus Bathyarchaeota archaeon]|nr:hypothetical protein [Candidatus Bathyarchaeota archaeon]